MKIPVMSIGKTEIGKKELPKQFSEEIRPDVIKRAVEVLQAGRRQPYGADPRAGQKVSAKISRRRRDYKGSYGHGISRVPRKIMSHRGTQFNWVGALAPGTVGGRRAHPPKAEKIWEIKINKKENRKAIRSAMAATMIKELVTQRGHKVPAVYPFIVENKMEDLDKTKQVQEVLEKLGLEFELGRTKPRKIRAGKGKLRGRKYKTKKGPLLVVSQQCKLLNAAENIRGIDIVQVNSLNAELLAPGCEMGRLTIFTQAAIERLEKENLFM
ncbi:50S ribosomal protein L4 [Candidatus Woesearchaeota archaeon]|nr:50S ribosomal protein L4 [Candidatus Woesearchaeota archaeon]